MKPEDLDLVPMDDLFAAVRRRMDCFIFAAVEKAKQDPDVTPVGTLYHGSHVACLGLVDHIQIELRGISAGIIDRSRGTGIMSAGLVALTPEQAKELLDRLGKTPPPDDEE